jgi:hypothetical protein
MQIGVACFTGDLATIDPAQERCRATTGGGDPLLYELPYVARAHALAVLGDGDPPRRLGAAARRGRPAGRDARLRRPP